MKSFRVLMQTGALLGGVVFASVALAAGTKAAKSDMSSADKIKAIDTDGDGILTAAEHAAGSRSMFEKMDADKDGALTKSEFDAGHAAMMTK